ncbi:MAG: hypothetical protein F6K55_25455 [Moorea sp. SIO4A3]|nr:hypothetical protein [Moorena sp. SIO4A3]
MKANCSIDCSLFPIPCSMSPISSKITMYLNNSPTVMETNRHPKLG